MKKMILLAGMAMMVSCYVNAQSTTKTNDRGKITGNDTVANDKNTGTYRDINRNNGTNQNTRTTTRNDDYQNPTNNNSMNNRNDMNRSNTRRKAGDTATTTR